MLITGGAGFLGSHLCERLLKQGANVLCADNYFTGTRRNIERMLIIMVSNSFGTMLRSRAMSKPIAL